ncbi:hypothetical protein GCM10009730_23380 [Streptomyces albidochromogenes]|uniref:hypothetical protein n=1 Tax=Streptomyces albidochromogenes TaxID=329524 RepID=UPI001FCC49EA|nr:hypothetical protein [Streptomyces albidochromogenes]
MTAADYDMKPDTAFLDDIAEVFRKHPRAAKKYGLASFTLERKMGIDYARKYGVSRIEGDRIITEFRDRENDPEVIRMQICVKYELRGQDLECVHWEEALE